MTPLPPFNWPRFLIAFVTAPLLVTALTAWAIIPLMALKIGGPLYLVAGLPVAAAYLRRNPPEVLPVILLALICQLLLIPILISFGWWTGDWDILETIPFFLFMGAVFALLWTGTFLLIYRALLSRQKENPDV